MMSEIERFEMEAELNGREDYLREAYGGEVDIMNEADRDHEEYLRQVWLDSLTPEERQLHEQLLEEQRRFFADYQRYEAEAAAEDCPF